MSKVRKRDAKIAVWGCGFVGTTNLLYLSDVGFDCLGIDIDEKRVAELKNGEYKINSDNRALGESVRKKPKFEVTGNPDEKVLNDIDIHYLCLPTEKKFKPEPKYIEDVISVIRAKARKECLIIVECSMPPTWIDKYIIDILKEERWELNKNYYLGAAPRRDLFGELEFELKTTARVIGASCNEAQKIMVELYGKYCNSIHLAKDCHHAVLSKIVENTYRCFDISLANQLNHGLSKYDITHVLELASTKWNVEKYHPSFGIGGYCIPLAPQYILEEMDYNSYESIIFNDIMRFNSNTIVELLPYYREVLDNASRIIVLGVSSIPNVGILNCSIGLMLVEELVKQNKNVYVNDPYIDDAILEEKTGCQTIRSLSDINDGDLIIIVTQHDLYKTLTKINGIKCTIIDTFGLCRELRDNLNVNYYEVGCNDIEKRTYNSKSIKAG